MKQIPENMIHISTFPVAEQAKLSKDVKVILHFFNSKLYEAATAFKSGNFYGPFIQS